MKDTGIIRKIDKLGRIVLPAELRKFLGLKEYDMVDITSEGYRIIITPFSRHNVCSICCRQDISLTTVGDGQLCRDCIKKVQEL